MVRSAIDRRVVERLYRDGLAAIDAISSSLDDRQWQSVACGHWTATETTRHVVSVIGWYHDWLDRAVAGDPSLPFAASEMDEQTASALVAVGDIGGPAATSRFVESAERYLDRLETNWALPFAYPRGVVTAGLHCGMAATEWHLHAWDLSRVTDDRHRPADPGALFAAAERCHAAAIGGARGTLMDTLVPIGQRLRPWETLLRQSGRTDESTR